MIRRSTIRSAAMINSWSQPNVVTRSSKDDQSISRSNQRRAIRSATRPRPIAGAHEEAELEQQRRDIGEFSDDIAEVNDRVFDVALQPEDELVEGVAELLQLQIIHVGQAARGVPACSSCTRARASFAACLA